MSFNIYLKELKRYRFSFIVWSASICALLIFGMMFYPVFSDGKVVAQVKVLFENPFMKNMTSAFGFGEVENLTNILGFFTSYSIIYFLLLGSMFSIMLASKILASEEGEKTAEFLLTKPVTRLEVALNKLLVLFTYVFLLNVILTFTGFILLEIYKKTDYKVSSYFILNGYTFCLMFTWGIIGFFISILRKRGKQNMGIAAGLVLGGYFIDALFRVVTQVSYLGYISPFKFVDTYVLRAGYGFEWWRMGYFILLTGLLTFLSLLFYKRKDILV